MIALNWIYPPKPKLVTEIWEWPLAVYPGPMFRQAAFVICETHFDDILAKSGNHKPLQVVFYQYNSGLNPDPRRMLSNNKFRTLREAIEFTHATLERLTSWHPLIK